MIHKCYNIWWWWCDTVYSWILEIKLIFRYKYRENIYKCIILPNRFNMWFFLLYSLFEDEKKEQMNDSYKIYYIKYYKYIWNLMVDVAVEFGQYVSPFFPLFLLLVLNWKRKGNECSVLQTCTEDSG